MVLHASRSLRAATSRLCRAGYLPGRLAGALPTALTGDPFAGQAMVVDDALAACLQHGVDTHLLAPPGEATDGDRPAASWSSAAPRPPAGASPQSTAWVPRRAAGMRAVPGADVSGGYSRRGPSTTTTSTPTAATATATATTPTAGRPRALLPDRSGGSGTGVREAGAGPSRLARHVHSLTAAAGGRWPMARRDAPRIPVLGEVPVRVVRDDELAARLRESARGRDAAAAAARPVSTPASAPSAPSSSPAAPTSMSVAAPAGASARRISGAGSRPNAAATSAPSGRETAALSRRPDGLAGLVDWWGETGGSTVATPPTAFTPPPSADSERLGRHAPQTVLRIEEFREALEQVLLDEAMADGLAVT